MREAVEQCGGHFRITEDARPFAKGEVGCDDDRGAPVEFADQMEQKLAAGLGEGQIAQLVQDQEVEARDQISGSALPFCTGFGIQLVHRIDAIEEPPATATADAGAGNTDGEVGFAGSGVSVTRDMSGLCTR